MRRRARITIETKTGEILANEEYGDRIRVTKATSIDNYRKIREEQGIARQQELDRGSYRVWATDSFYKGNIEIIRGSLGSLDVYEKAFLYSIGPYVGYEDCCIKYDNGKELSFKKLSEISGISTGKLSKVIKQLVDKNIICKIKSNRRVRYYINPLFFSKGNRIRNEVLIMFGKE